MEEAVRVSRDAGALAALSIGLSMLCNMFVDVTDIDEGLALTDEAIVVASQLGDQISIAVSAGSRAALFEARGEPLEALAVAQRGADAIRSSNNLTPLAPLLSSGALALAQLGDYHNAAILFGATAKHMFGTPPDWVLQRMQAAEATVRTELGHEFQPLYDQGMALTSLEASAFLATLDATVAS